MFHLFFALFMAFACPSHHTTNPGNTGVTTLNAPPPDSGGDDGHIRP